MLRTPPHSKSKHRDALIWNQLGAPTVISCNPRYDRRFEQHSQIDTEPRQRQFSCLCPIEDAEKREVALFQAVGSMRNELSMSRLHLTAQGEGFNAWGSLSVRLGGEILQVETTNRRLHSMAKVFEKTGSPSCAVQFFRDYGQVYVSTIANRHDPQFQVYYVNQKLESDTLQESTRAAISPKLSMELAYSWKPPVLGSSPPVAFCHESDGGTSGLQYALLVRDSATRAKVYSISMRPTLDSETLMPKGVRVDEPTAISLPLDCEPLSCSFTPLHRKHMIVGCPFPRNLLSIDLRDEKACSFSNADIPYDIGSLACDPNSMYRVYAGTSLSTSISSNQMAIHPFNVQHALPIPHAGLKSGPVLEFDLRMPWRVVRAHGAMMLTQGLSDEPTRSSYWGVGVAKVIGKKEHDRSDIVALPLSSTGRPSEFAVVSQVELPEETTEQAEGKKSMSFCKTYPYEPLQGDMNGTRGIQAISFRAKVNELVHASRKGSIRDTDIMDDEEDDEDDIDQLSGNHTANSDGSDSSDSSDSEDELDLDKVRDMILVLSMSERGNLISHVLAQGDDLNCVLCSDLPVGMKAVFLPEPENIMEVNDASLVDSGSGIKLYVSNECPLPDLDISRFLVAWGGVVDNKPLPPGWGNFEVQSESDDEGALAANVTIIKRPVIYVPGGNKRVKMNSQMEENVPEGIQSSFEVKLTDINSDDDSEEGDIDTVKDTEDIRVATGLKSHVLYEMKREMLP